MTGNGGTTYVYDAENRLVWTTGGYRYVYDGDGNRVEKCVAGSAITACPTSGTNGTLYWMGGGTAALDESDLSGNMLEQYVFFGGVRVARRDVSTSAVHYYFSDQVGSHSVVANAAGTVTEQDIDYYPYGGQENDYSPNVAQHYKFNGKERDAESGLDNFGARFDASSLGRFMTPDWAAKPTAVPYAHFGNPQSLNLYAYAENNPTTLGDPDGHCPDEARWLQCAASVVAEANAALEWSQSGTANTQQATQNLSAKSEKAILRSNLTSEQADALEASVVGAGNRYGVNPNTLVGMAMKESSLDPTATAKEGTASGLYGLTEETQNTYGIDKSIATGSSPTAIASQTFVAANYLHDLMQGPVPSSHPSHQMEIALGYYRGKRASVNKAIGSKGGYDAMLKLRFQGESLRQYINYVESYQ